MTKQPGTYFSVLLSGFLMEIRAQQGMGSHSRLVGRDGVELRAINLEPKYS